jgi:hypothetical protein
MRTMHVGVGLVVMGAVASGCGSSHVVEVTLSSASFATSGGNLFNCSTPAGPANRDGVSTGVIGCNPIRNADGTYSTTPVTVTEQVGCGDGHGAMVTVTCAGTGNGHDVTGSVTLSISASCGSQEVGDDPQTFVFQDIAATASQTGPAMASCSAFGDLCSPTDTCAFNSFQAGVTVTNLGE